MTAILGISAYYHDSAAVLIGREPFTQQADAGEINFDSLVKSRRLNLVG